MTQRAAQKVAVLRRATERYSPRVEHKLSEAGKRVNTPMVESAAKYYVALRKLAEK